MSPFNTKTQCEMRFTHTPFFLLVLVCLNYPVYACPERQAPEISGSSILFIENKGQILDNHGNPATDVLFAVYQNSMTTFIHRDGISYQFIIDNTDKSMQRTAPGLSQEEEEAVQPIIRQTYRTQMHFVGAHTDAVATGNDPTTYVENYYFPEFPDGILDVKSFRQVTITNIYDGIDWVIYSNGENLKYDFIVHPGADASVIKMQVNAADGINLVNSAQIKIQTKLGDIIDSKLFCYSKESGAEIKSSFNLQKNIVTIDLAGYDNSQTLIIDPAVIWATLYGGEGEDAVNSLDFADDGFFYGAGYTGSHEGIGYLGYDSIYNGGPLDIHILKFDTLGNKLWGTYFGGNDSDLGSNIHVPGDGYVYVSGFSASWNLPTTFTSFQPFNAGWFDAVAAKFDVDGHRIWATYFGGWSNDYGRGIKVDPTTGDIYLAGSAYSNDLGYMGHENMYQGWGDELLVKFDNDGDRIWSTYYGGNLEDVSRDVTVAHDGNVYLVGYSESTSGVYYNGFDSTLAGKHDATIAKFAPGGELIWGTYFGGKKDDNGNDVELDANGNVYVAAQMGSNGLAVDGYQMAFGGDVDAMLMKFRPDGTLDFATYLGGTSEDEGKFVRCLGDAVYMTGYAYSNGLSVNGWQDSLVGSADGIIAKFDTSGNFYWSSYLGGSDVDYLRGVDGTTNNYSIYIGGKTFSPDFPTTPGAFHETYQGGLADGYIWKILLCSEGFTYYQDLDGDGYGNDLVATEGCFALPPGYATVGGDCDDLVATTYPSAAELCNSIDDDCDLIADDEVIYAAISPSGPTDFCKGGNVTLSATAGAGYTYQWKKNGLNVTGATSSTYNTTKAGDFAVSVTVPGGCNDLSETTTVNVWTKPNPIVSPLGDLDICATGSVKLKTPNAALSTFQWFKDAGLIIGATSNVYIATSPGNYKVKQTTEHGCTKTSLPVTVTMPCKMGDSYAELSVYPNPASEKFNFYLNTGLSLNSEVIINIYNEMGEVIYSVNGELNDGKLIFEINLPAGTSNGIYLVQATTNNQVYSQQIIVSK